MQREFYARDAAVVAKELLGKVLVHETPEGVTKGMIVETEAYYGELDPGSHAYGGRRTKRNEVMWGPPGYAYVYFTYGMHYMLNVVTGKEGEARAVLIRAIEPLEGIELMRKRRGMVEFRSSPRRGGEQAPSEFQLTNGPGKVTQAFGIAKNENGVDMLNSNLRIEEHPTFGGTRDKIVAAPRIGIKNDPGENLRFYIACSKFVSKV